MTSLSDLVCRRTLRLTPYSLDLPPYSALHQYCPLCSTRTGEMRKPTWSSNKVRDCELVSDLVCVMCLTCHYSIILPSICRPISQVRLCSVLTPRYNYYNGGVSELGKNSPCLGQDVINDVLPWDCTSCICYQYWRGPAQTGSDWRPPPGVSACRGAPLSRTARTAGNQNLQQTNVITLT